MNRLRPLHRFTSPAPSPSRVENADDRRRQGRRGKTTTAVALFLPRRTKAKVLLIYRPAASIADALGESDAGARGLGTDRRAPGLVVRQMDAAPRSHVFAIVSGAHRRCSAHSSRADRRRRTAPFSAICSPRPASTSCSLSLLGALAERRFAHIVVDPRPPDICFAPDMPRRSRSTGHTAQRLMLKYRDVVGLGDGAGAASTSPSERAPEQLLHDAAHALVMSHSTNRWCAPRRRGCRRGSRAAYQSRRDSVESRKHPPPLFLPPSPHTGFSPR